MIQRLFDRQAEIITGPFSQAEIDTAVKALKNGKAPGLDGLPPEFWKLPKIKKQLRKLCNATYQGTRPTEWGISGLVPIPKKGDLRIPDNYRGIALSQISAKIYSRCLLNRIRPVIDKILRNNQNGFREGRSTSAHILALRRIYEELKNFNNEAVLVFIDFKKAFDSIVRDKMFEILLAYGIPQETVDAIKTMYQDTQACVITAEGITEAFDIATGVLQGDPLAPFLFIICLDYALRTSITNLDGLTLTRRRSRRFPAVRLADLDYADDIALLENSITDAQSLLLKVEKACLAIGLTLNASKTKYMHINASTVSILNSSNGSNIDKVNDFKYLGSFCDTEYDMSLRIGQAWSTLHSLERIWKSRIKKETKTKVFRTCVETILLYGSESWCLNKTRNQRLDGTYTKMLRRIYGIPWQAHVTNRQLYGSLHALTRTIQSRRLKLAGHAVRSKEPAGQLLLWEPEGRRRVGRPFITVKSLIQSETDLNDNELRNAMLDRDYWRSNFVKIPPPNG